MNKWQKLFLEHYYKGKTPGDKRGQKQLQLLENIGETVSVTFPEMEGVNGVKPAHTDTYLVTANRCDMRHGVISAVVLSWQILKWDQMGYMIESDEAVIKTA